MSKYVEEIIFTVEETRTYTITASEVNKVNTLYHRST